MKLCMGMIGDTLPPVYTDTYIRRISHRYFFNDRFQQSSNIAYERTSCNDSNILLQCISCKLGYIFAFKKLKSGFMSYGSENTRHA